MAAKRIRRDFEKALNNVFKPAEVTEIQRAVDSAIKNVSLMEEARLSAREITLANIEAYVLPNALYTVQMMRKALQETGRRDKASSKEAASIINAIRTVARVYRPDYIPSVTETSLHPEPVG